MEFEIGEVTDPLPGTAAKFRSSAFSDAVNNLPLGKAFVVKGMARANAASRVNALGKMSAPRKKFSTVSLPDGGVQILRVL